MPKPNENLEKNFLQADIKDLNIISHHFTKLLIICQKDNNMLKHGYMNLHEYQAKALLKQEGIAIPKFGVASNIQEVKHVINQLDLNQGIVKAQVHAGGRYKAGAIKIAKSPSKILDCATDILNTRVINKQTGPKGLLCTKVLISELIDVDQ